MRKKKKRHVQHGLNRAADRMDCKELFALLSRYIDADLKPGTCSEIERHLKGCDPCIAFVNTLRKTAVLCRQYQPAELPRPLRKQAQEQLRAAYEAACAGPKSRVPSPKSQSPKS